MPEDPPAALKDWFDEARYRSIASQLSSLEPKFRADVFLPLVLDGLEPRSLMQRLHQCSIATEAALPGNYRSQLKVLRKLAPLLEHGFISIFLCDFVSTFGTDDFDHSLEALAHFTCFGSGEFAVRTFLIADQARTLATMHRWATHENEHVRRLASEGSRPRLPWGTRLPSLVRDPSPVLPLLEQLKNDPAIYVRRSVANHLNDITKDHPERVLDLLSAWDLTQPELLWIAKQACRTLIKRGHPRALALFGFGKKAEVTATLQATPAQLHLGDRLTLTAQLTSTSKKPQRLAIDYVIHYVKARGVSAEKVFKWTELDLPPGTTLDLTRSQHIRDFTTRKHHPGHHKIELQINGNRSAATTFELQFSQKEKL
jgi:3-methyladenine DNA glycosylase AlkC